MEELNNLNNTFKEIIDKNEELINEIPEFFNRTKPDYRIAYSFAMDGSPDDNPVDGREEPMKDNNIMVHRYIEEIKRVYCLFSSINIINVNQIKDYNIKYIYHIFENVLLSNPNLNLPIQLINQYNEKHHEGLTIDGITVTMTYPQLLTNLNKCNVLCLEIRNLIEQFMNIVPNTLQYLCITDMSFFDHPLPIIQN
jgi:hypothetical protein